VRTVRYLGNEFSPTLYAWCDAEDRAGAFIAALAAMAHSGVMDFSMTLPRELPPVPDYKGPTEGAIALARAHFMARASALAVFEMPGWLGQRSQLWLHCYGEEADRRFPTGPLRMTTGLIRQKHGEPVELATNVSLHSVASSAAAGAIDVQRHIEELMLGLCAPDAEKRVTTGTCTGGFYWFAPLENGATYHADGRVARDLALTWVQLHDGDLVGRAARFSLDELAARVEAAPPGATVGVGPSIDRANKHQHLDSDGARTMHARPTRPDSLRSGPRAIFPGDILLTREQVLRALATPPEALLQALEAVAVPDAEWRAAEGPALEMIEAKKQGAPTFEVDIFTREHVHFVEQHAPYHVRRLPSGAVMLATHPFRTLGLLYQDALSLLGITA
jgi:hypothetical protein